MRAKVIQGDSAILSATAFGRRKRESIDRGIERLRSFGRNLRSGTLDRIERLEKNIRRYFDEDIDEAIRDVNKRRKVGFRDDVIMYLGTAEEIADAGPSYRRWLLANKRLGNLFRQQRVDGWGAAPDYLDVGPNDRDPYYEAVYNGVVQEDAEQPGVFYSEYCYGGNEVNGEYLTPGKQVDILATFDVIDDLLDQNIDPTSPTGETL